jgi:hypothetical protein
MKSALRIHPKQLSIGAKTHDDWFAKLVPFITHVSELLDERIGDDERIGYGDDLIRALSKLARYSYLVRWERDKALAAGYEKFPKPQYNSDAAEALARNYASEEVRLRDLLSELEAALKLRASLNQSALSYQRAQLTNGG